MKKILIVLLSLTLLITVVGCGQEEVAKPNEDAEVKEEAGVVVILNNTERTQEDKWDELQEGKELLILDVTITNNTDKEYEFMPDYFSLDVDGNREVVTDVAPKEGDILHVTDIPAGESITGLINFQTEEGTEYKIIYNDFDIEMEIE